MSKVVKIPFDKTSYFSKTVVDYLLQKEELKPFYGYFPTIENFSNQIKLKEKFPIKNREVLVASLTEQYKSFSVSKSVHHNINSLLSKKTFTVTTGHQLNLFTGPLYFLYKIIATINLSKRLKKQYPDYYFVPIYWMATEDHDFEEINYFNFKNKKFQWIKDAKGAVGRLDTNGLEKVYKTFEKALGVGKNATFLKDLFYKAYCEHDNLSDATRFLANELFKHEGLVIVDADKKELKELFIPYLSNELESQTSFKEVSKTINALSKNYKIQVNPREINLFYLIDNLRERILFNTEGYSVNNTSITFTKDEILTELKNHPERFSPNVIMRPLYQEVILPNLAYIGGGGELAYWFELKNYFKAVQVPFPILMLRDSVLLMRRKQYKKIEKLGISISDLFLPQAVLVKKIVVKNSNLDLDFSAQKQFLREQFVALKKMAVQTDKSFIGAVLAQEKKQLNGLDNLEKRILKAEKKKLASLVERVVKLQNDLFPNLSLQERQINFSEFYIDYGNDLKEELIANINPLKMQFSVLILSL
ncbi:MAG TPA: bacillithiol biosynthesis cysteine-adding enzyme BshC [Flavobacteriia bacterium]|nr:bacillithiol biosynthesis cysteine-adding enzyme BshC [Flavobacteriia bacterium]